MGLFAFVCGRVVSPRAEISMPMATGFAKLVIRLMTVAFAGVLLFLTPRQGYPALSVLLPAIAVFILIAYSRGVFRDIRRTSSKDLGMLSKDSEHEEKAHNGKHAASR